MKEEIKKHKKWLKNKVKMESRGHGDKDEWHVVKKGSHMVQSITNLKKKKKLWLSECADVEHIYWTSLCPPGLPD